MSHSHHASAAVRGLGPRGPDATSAKTMRRGADAAPSRSRNVGLTTLVLAGLCMLGLATSQAVAQGLPQQTPTEPTTGTAPAPPPPAPDPRPAPKTGPKPARPRQAVPPKAPPPPPPVERAARPPIATTALSPTAPPKARTRHLGAVPPRKRATSPAVRPGKTRRGSTRRARSDRTSVHHGGSRWFRTGAHRLLRWNRRSTSPSHRRQSSRNHRASPSPRLPRFSS